MGGTQKQFKLGHKLRMRMVSLNRPAKKPCSKWSILCETEPGKGVFGCEEDPERGDSISAHLELSAYPAAAIKRTWFRRPEPVSAGLRAQAMQGMLFQSAQRIDPLMAQSRFSPAKAESEKVLVEKVGPESPSYKHTDGVMSASGTGGAMGGSVRAAGVVLFPQQEQLTRLLDTPLRQPDSS